MKIAIAGFGQEGRSNYKYFRAQYPQAEVVIVDEREPVDVPLDANIITGEGVFERLNGFDMVVRTAGLAPGKITTDGKVWSATNEFFAQCPVPIIGVTGTKGKGTTSSLIASILRAAGKTVHLVGNIGVPALETLPSIGLDDIVVYELSSFQLWDIERSPRIAVVLMIEPDHLDVHADLEDYVEAKANIRRYQEDGDVCVYHPTNKYAEKIADVPLAYETKGGRSGLSGASSGVYRYASKDDGHVYAEDGFFCVQDRQICTIDNLTLPGAHNIENACAAISAVIELPEWPVHITDEHIAKGLRDFTGLPHRLKFVREVGGVKYYDDSIATTPGSAIAAINSFDERVTIILGGHDKGGDLTDLMKLCHDKHVSVIAIGESRQQIADLCAHYGVKCCVEPGDMTAIVERAAMETETGSVVVLSPAAASFDMFKNYADRGTQFVAAVTAL